MRFNLDAEVINLYKVFIKDIALLKIFLSINDTDYVDVILNDEKSSMVTNTGEIFSILNLRTLAKSESLPTGKEEVESLHDNVKIRIPKVILAKFVREDSIEIEIEGDMISASLLNENDVCYCKIRFTKQNFPVIGFKEKIDTINRAMREQSTIDLEEFSSLDKMIKTTKSILNVSDGVAMIAAFNSRVYREVKQTSKFAVTAFAYSVLKRCSTVVYNIDNYLIARNGGLFVVVNKCKGFSNEEYPLFKTQKASLVCEIDLTDVKDFLSKIPVNCTYIGIGIKNRMSVFNDGNVIYEVPIKIGKLNTVSENLSEVKIPKVLFHEILFNLDLHKITLAKKKTFTQLRCNDLMIVF